MNKLWFSEDDDYVWGYKTCFESEDEFIKEANKEHIEMAGFGCEVGKVECDVFLMSEDPIEGEYCVRLRDSKIEIATLYFASCESLEY